MLWNSACSVAAVPVMPHSLGYWGQHGTEGGGKQQQQHTRHGHLCSRSPPLLWLLCHSSTATGTAGGGACTGLGVAKQQ